MGENDQSRIQSVWWRLTGQDPRSVKLQVLMAAGFALASYMFFFVFTHGSARTAYDAGGNIRADGETHTAPLEFEEERGEKQPQDSLVSDIGRVLQGTGRRAALAKFTEAEYEAFFGRLAKLGSEIKTETESGGGVKARFELRYRALDEAVTTILENDISVFTSDRELVSKWQAVKAASAEVYRITFPPIARPPDFSGPSWHYELTEGFASADDWANQYSHSKHQEAIAIATKRVFDQRLTVGEYEDVLAADEFIRETHLAIDKAHQIMEAFHDALKAVGETNSVVKAAIRRRRIIPRDESGGLDLIASFRADYDMPTILGFGPRGPRETITRPMDGIIITSYHGDPGDSSMLVDFLSNLTRPEKTHDINSDRLDLRHVEKPHTDESHAEKPSAKKNRVDKGRENELIDKKKLGEPDWLGGEPSRNGPRSGHDKKSRENQKRKKRSGPGKDRP